VRAAIDCGTNSFRLLIVDGTGRPVIQELRITRLGEGVHEHREIAPQAMTRAIAALEEFQTLIEQHHVQDVRAVATSAARDATNGETFLIRAAAALGGVRLEILSGQEEGELTYKGAASGVDAGGPMLVVDIGGGSTEFAFGVNGELQWARSVDIGSVRITELDLHGDPYAPHEVATASARIDQLIAPVELQRLPAGTVLVGVAGTITTVAMIARGLDHWEPDIVHGLHLPAAEVHEVTERLLTMSNEERLAIPGLPPGRADVIGGGALVFQRVIETAGFSATTVSERDLLWGLLL
jgi:exopolyphosphatase/guanosine-5'-triphosphate,3'-diphosphate pyrophosphatase